MHPIPSPTFCLLVSYTGTLSNPTGLPRHLLKGNTQAQYKGIRTAVIDIVMQHKEIEFVRGKFDEHTGGIVKLYHFVQGSGLGSVSLADVHEFRNRINNLSCKFKDEVKIIGTEKWMGLCYDVPIPAAINQEESDHELFNSPDSNAWMARPLSAGGVNATVESPRTPKPDPQSLLFFTASGKYIVRLESKGRFKGKLPSDHKLSTLTASSLPPLVYREDLYVMTPKGQVETFSMLSLVNSIQKPTEPLLPINQKVYSNPSVISPGPFCPAPSGVWVAVSGTASSSVKLHLLQLNDEIKKDPPVAKGASEAGTPRPLPVPPLPIVLEGEKDQPIAEETNIQDGKRSVPVIKHSPSVKVYVRRASKNEMMFHSDDEEKKKLVKDQEGTRLSIGESPKNNPMKKDLKIVEKPKVNSDKHISIPQKSPSKNNFMNQFISLNKNKEKKDKKEKKTEKNKPKSPKPKRGSFTLSTSNSTGSKLSKCIVLTTDTFVKVPTPLSVVAVEGHRYLLALYLADPPEQKATQPPKLNAYLCSIKEEKVLNSTSIILKDIKNSVSRVRVFELKQVWSAIVTVSNRLVLMSFSSQKIFIVFKTKLTCETVGETPSVKGRYNEWWIIGKFGGILQLKIK